MELYWQQNSTHLHAYMQCGLGLHLVYFTIILSFLFIFFFFCIIIPSIVVGIHITRMQFDSATYLIFHSSIIYPAQQTRQIDWLADWACESAIYFASSKIHTDTQCQCPNLCSRSYFNVATSIEHFFFCHFQRHH